MCRNFRGLPSGGSALNSGQVGSTRAAEHIIISDRKADEKADFNPEIDMLMDIIKSSFGEENTLERFREKCQSLMSETFSVCRSSDKMKNAKGELFTLLKNFTCENRIKDNREIRELFKNLDMLVSQLAVASAMVYAAEENGSQGAGLVISEGKTVPEKEGAGDFVLTQYPLFHGGVMEFEHRKEPCRPIPERDNWFENLWSRYRERNKISDI